MIWIIQSLFDLDLSVDKGSSMILTIGFY